MLRRRSTRGISSAATRCPTAWLAFALSGSRFALSGDGAPALAGQWRSCRSQPRARSRSPTIAAVGEGVAAQREVGSGRGKREAGSGRGKRGGTDQARAPAALRRQPHPPRCDPPPNHTSSTGPPGSLHATSSALNRVVTRQHSRPRQDLGSRPPLDIPRPGIPPQVFFVA